MRSYDLVIIQDTRSKLSSITFSNYKKSTVIKKLNHALYYQKIEEAFFWTCELMCSNLYLDMWNVFFIFVSKYIHIDNPRLPLFLKKKYTDFIEIAHNVCDDFSLRNRDDIRVLFCSISLILCLSNKYTILDDLNYKFNFKIENIYENLKAPNMDYVEFIYKQHDPKEYIIPFNEFIYHLLETKNKIDITYWINWIIHYDSLCNSKKKHIFCQQRDIFQHKNDKLSKNIIWILWDTILKATEKDKSKPIQEIIKSIFYLFSCRYAVSFNKKRKVMIYHCIELYLRDTINIELPVIKNKESVFQHLPYNVNIIFEQLKKKEVREIQQPDKKLSAKEEKNNMLQNIYNTIT